MAISGDTLVLAVPDDFVKEWIEQRYAPTVTAALARVHPHAGGAYAYGRAYLSRPAGVVAGYAFVLGKSASAGAAALTIGAYAWPGYERLIGLVAVAVALVLDLRGIVRSVRVTAVLVAFVLVVLGCLMLITYFPSISLALRDLVFAAPEAVIGPVPAPAIGPQ